MSNVKSPVAFELERRSMLVRIWKGYKAYRLVGFGRFASLKYSYEVHG
jgi:hypothetical protein